MYSYSLSLVFISPTGLMNSPLSLVETQYFITLSKAILYIICAHVTNLDISLTAFKMPGQVHFSRCRDLPTAVLYCFDSSCIMISSMSPIYRVLPVASGRVRLMQSMLNLLLKLLMITGCDNLVLLWLLSHTT
jgi:hypothetical protein